MTFIGRVRFAFAPFQVLSISNNSERFSKIISCISVWLSRLRALNIQRYPNNNKFEDIGLNLENFSVDTFGWPAAVSLLITTHNRRGCKSFMLGIQTTEL
ncbi:hypothetical protein [Parasitella parasitica]|uniref:Uncharacterized protein n=1 Tax=Parasitella parasitica TaxID=35722 RepID=A0A0B7N6X4_9FUNG|nr:hypothetical protein [Parasitella parasitica]